MHHHQKELLRAGIVGCITSNMVVEYAYVLLYIPVQCYYIIVTVVTSAMNNFITICSVYKTKCSCYMLYMYNIK